MENINKHFRKGYKLKKNIPLFATVIVVSFIVTFAVLEKPYLYIVGLFLFILFGHLIESKFDTLLYTKDFEQDQINRLLSGDNSQLFLAGFLSAFTAQELFPEELLTPTFLTRISRNLSFKDLNELKLDPILKHFIALINNDSLSNVEKSVIFINLLQENNLKSVYTVSFSYYLTDIFNRDLSTDTNYIQELKELGVIDSSDLSENWMTFDLVLTSEQLIELLKTEPNQTFDFIFPIYLAQQEEQTVQTTEFDTLKEDNSFQTLDEFKDFYNKLG